MDQLDLEHGLKGMLLSLIGLVAANLIAHIVKGVWAFARRNIGPTQDQFKDLTKSLQENNSALTEQKLITLKISSDIHRIYLFLKVIAGDKWREYRKQVEDMEKEENLNS